MGYRFRNEFVMKWQNKWYINGFNFGPWVEMAKLLFWPASQRESSTTRVFSIGSFLIYARTVSHSAMNDGKTDNLCLREGFCIGIHNFPLTKHLSSNGLIPKRSTDYHATIITCLASSSAALPLLCVKYFVIVLYFWHSLRWHYARSVGHTKQRCSGPLFLPLGSSFVVEMKRTGR